MRAITIALLLLAAPAFAAESDLRAQIRADLMQDPRTAEMSPEELDALVAALADEAEAAGTATIYLDAKSAPTFVYDPPPRGESVIELLVSAPIVIALSALIAGILGLILLIRHRRRPAVPVAPDLLNV